MCKVPFCLFLSNCLGGNISYPGLHAITSFLYYPISFSFNTIWVEAHWILDLVSSESFPMKWKSEMRSVLKVPSWWLNETQSSELWRLEWNPLILLTNITPPRWCSGEPPDFNIPTYVCVWLRWELSFLGYWNHTFTLPFISLSYLLSQQALSLGRRIPMKNWRNWERAHMLQFTKERASEYRVHVRSDLTQPLYCSLKPLIQAVDVTFSYTSEVL